MPLNLKPHAKIFTTNKEVQDIWVAFDRIKDSIHLLAQQKYKKAADKHRRPLEFHDDDWVLLWFAKAWLQHTIGKNSKVEHTNHQKFI